jgi:succinate dehydrogenase/fumarate reductase cytochrome b subunit
MDTIFKIMLFICVFAMIFALFRGLYTLVKDKKGERTLTALKWRIGFAVLVVITLILGMYTGSFKPHTLPQVIDKTENTDNP